MDRAEAKILGRFVKGPALSEHFKKDGVLYALVGELLRQAESLERLFLNANLATNEGVQAAVQTQADLRAIVKLVDQLEELEHGTAEPTIGGPDTDTRGEPERSGGFEF